jgi:hypothetical protein
MVTTAVPLAEPEVAVIVSVPLATAVTSPADETVAIVVSDDAHVTVAPEIAVPPASLTVAASVTVSPMDAKDFVLGDSATLDAVWVTVTTAVPLADPEVAVIVSVPLATAVTSPPDDTVAIDVLDDAQVTVVPDMVAPPASFTVAARVTVSPTDTRVFVLGASVTLEAAWVTVTAAVPLTDPDVDVIVAVPFATAVTSPADETVAVASLDVAHVTAAPEIAVPPASCTAAARVTVSPMDANVFVLGDTVTLDAT